MEPLGWILAGVAWCLGVAWSMRTAPHMPAAMEERERHPLHKPLSERLASREAWRGERQTIDQICAEALGKTGEAV